jgi:hypothetical protein
MVCSFFLVDGRLVFFPRDSESLSVCVYWNEEEEEEGRPNEPGDMVGGLVEKCYVCVCMGGGLL